VAMLNGPQAPRSIHQLFVIPGIVVNGVIKTACRKPILQRERESTPVETASRRRVAFEWPALPHVNTSGNVALKFNNLDLKPLFLEIAYHR